MCVCVCVLEVRPQSLARVPKRVSNDSTAFTLATLRKQTKRFFLFAVSKFKMAAGHKLTFGQTLLQNHAGDVKNLVGMLLSVWFRHLGNETPLYFSTFIVCRESQSIEISRWRHSEDKRKTTSCLPSLF